MLLNSLESAEKKHKINPNSVQHVIDSSVPVMFSPVDQVYIKIVTLKMEEK